MDLTSVMSSVFIEESLSSWTGCIGSGSSGCIACSSAVSAATHKTFYLKWAKWAGSFTKRLVSKAVQTARHLPWAYCTIFKRHLGEYMATYTATGGCICLTTCGPGSWLVDLHLLHLWGRSHFGPGMPLLGQPTQAPPQQGASLPKRSHNYHGADEANNDISAR